jgi:GT2 family glycosyltransferase
MNRHADVRLIISDNSDNAGIKCESQQQIQQLDAIYLDNNGNIGLSKAYNRILDYIEDGPFWLMLSDDDTIFSPAFLENAYTASKKTNAHAISGIIRTGDQVMSPVRKNSVFPRKSMFIDKPGKYNNIYCINSGLIIRSSVFSKIGRYDEKLFLDMIDYWFMDELINNNINEIEIVEGSIDQNFSANEKQSSKAKWKRFGIYRKDFLIYCQLTDKPARYKWGIIAKRFLSIKVSDLKSQLKKA